MLELALPANCAISSVYTCRLIRNLGLLPAVPRESAKEGRLLSETDINDLCIRSMTSGDLEAALSLSTAAGWNQSLADWRRMFFLEPHGCLVAEQHGHVVGTTLCCTFDRVAWLAMVIVDQAFRCRGIGRRLVEAGLHYAEQQGAQTVRLDATRLGEAVYRQLKFEPQSEFIRMAGTVASDVVHEQIADFQISLADSAKLPTLLQQDFFATQTDRSKLLRRLFQEWAPSFANSLTVTSSEKNVAGFLGSRRGRLAVQLGPCVGSEPAAIALLQNGLRSSAGQSVIVDIPADAATLLSVAQRFGLTEQRRLLRMCRGPEVRENRQLYHASYGGEFG
jgi:predicted N-acetyltransferase YhbS